MVRQNSIRLQLDEAVRHMTHMLDLAPQNGPFWELAQRPMHQVTQLFHSNKSCSQAAHSIPNHSKYAQSFLKKKVGLQNPWF